MVVVTVLLAKGVPECTTVGVNVGSRTIESKVLTPTSSPVWGEDVSLTQELEGQHVAHMVFALLRNSERVGQAALTLDTTQAFGHRALPVEPHGTLMVSWASEPVSLDNKPVPSATSPSAAAVPASPNRIPGAGAVPPPYPHAAESAGVLFGRHPGLQPPVQYQPPQLEAVAATPPAAAETQQQQQQAPASCAREKSPPRETERAREQEWEKERDRLTPGGIPVDSNRHTAFSVLREEKLDRDTVSIKSQLLHQLLEEMKAMQEKMSQMSQQQDRLERAVATLQKSSGSNSK